MKNINKEIEEILDKLNLEETYYEIAERGIKDLLNSHTKQIREGIQGMKEVGVDYPFGTKFEDTGIYRNILALLEQEK